MIFLPITESILQAIMGYNGVDSLYGYRSVASVYKYIYVYLGSTLLGVLSQRVDTLHNI